MKKKSVLNLYSEELAHIQASENTQSGCKVNALVYATLSEKENPSKSVAIQIKSEVDRRRHWLHETNQQCNQVPFMQHVMGYSHKLFLTVGAGCGYLLGIFLANFFADGKGWRSEYAVLLQLILALLFSGGIAGIGMSGSIFRPFPPTRQSEDKRFPILDATSTSPNPKQLHVVLGCRPDLDEIASNMRDTCLKNGFPSVGVAVCGPIGLTDAAVRACHRASRSGGVPFVIDCETFDW